MNYSDTTICAIATAPGGALGIIRLSGNKSFDIISKCCKFNTTNIIPNSLRYTKFFDNNSQLLDDVVLSIYKNPHSYTGEDSIEISCHGSNYIMQKILETLVSYGATLAGPGEFTMRAFLNGKLDLSQAEAVSDLILSNNKSTHDVAINQLGGKVSNELYNINQKLKNICSYLELELDFSEEDVEFVDRIQLMNLCIDVQNKFKKLIESFKYGNAIKNGIPVAIIGAPNVGKSTLLNNLLNDDKAIISDIPGTTRDVIEDTVNINGINFRFVDTAGIRHTDDAIEKIGIERSIKAAEKAKIIILLADPNNTVIDITNKIDLSDKIIITKINKTNEFSALNNIGIDILKNELVNAIKNNINDEYVIINNIRHIELLQLALNDLTNAMNNMQTNITYDLIAEDIHSCINHISEITGEITSEDILKNIFSHFCIGK